MAEEHRKELTEFGEAVLRWTVCAEAAAAGDRAEAEEDALYDAARSAALRYPPIAEAASKGTDEDEDEAWNRALMDYCGLVVGRAGSKGAGVVAVVVTAVVILRFWTGSPPEENLGAAMLSVVWWGVPAVLAGGTIWGMRYLRNDEAGWKTVFTAPRDARERLWRFLLDSTFCMFEGPISFAALCIGLGGLGIFVLDLPPEHMTGHVIGVVGFLCIPWGRLWRAVRRVLARPI